MNIRFKSFLISLFIIFMVSSSMTAFAQYSDKIMEIASELNDFSITPAHKGDGYAILGTKTNTSGKQHGIVIRTDNSGNPIWIKELDEKSGTKARFFHIESYKNGFVMVGIHQNDPVLHGWGNYVYLLALDDNGNTISSTVYSEGNMGWMDHWNGLHVLYTEQHGDPGFIVTGFRHRTYTTPLGFNISDNKELVVMRTTEQGSVQWMNHYNTTKHSQMDMDMGSFTLETDRGFYITGSTNILKDNQNVNQGTLSMMLNYDGTIQWVNNFATYALSESSTEYEYGTGAVLSSNGHEIIVLSYSDENKTYFLTRIDKYSGSIIYGNMFPNQDGLTTVGLTLGRNRNNEFIVTGLIEEVEFNYNCTQSFKSAVPFISVISPDLSSAQLNNYYPMYAADFNTSGGDVFGPFGGNSSIHRPWIYTPEMAYVNPDEERVVFVGYRDGGAPNMYDLQIVNTEGPDYRWCESVEFTIRPEDPSYNTQQNMTMTTPNDVFTNSGPVVTHAEYNTQTCANISNIPGNFPVSMIANNSSSSVHKDGYSHSLQEHNGYYYSSGNFKNSFSFGSINVNSGVSHLRPWIAKLDVNGNEQWIKTASGSTTDARLTGTTIDNNGNVYAVGYFFGGNLKFGNTTLTPSNPNHYVSFIVKYSPTGNLLWANLIDYHSSINTSLAGARIWAIEHDGSGNIIITGTGAGEVTFPGSTHHAFNMSGGYDYRHPFLAKINGTTGNTSWITDNLPSALETVHSEVFTITQTSNGNIFVGGVYDVINERQLIIKFNSNGSYIDYKKGLNDEGSLWNLTSSGNDIYAVGYFDNSINFLNQVYTSNRTGSGFVMKLDQNLNSLIFQPITGSGMVYTNTVPHVVYTDGSDVYVGGSTTAPITNYSGISQSLSTGGSKDLFIVKYNMNLTPQWAQNKGGLNTQALVRDFVKDPVNCGITYTGHYAYGPINVGPLNLPTPVGTNFFYARIDDNSVAYKIASEQDGVDDELTSVSDIIVYPNPAHSHINIELENLTEDWLLHVYTITGQRILSKHNLTPTLTLNLNTFNEGTYMYQVILSNGTIKTGKFIIK